MNEVMASGKQKRTRSLYYFVGSLIVALVLTWLLKEPAFTDSQLYVLFLLFFATGLWVTDAIPAFAVALFIMAYLVFTLGNPHFNSRPEKIDPYVNTFSSSIIWLLLGGFFMALAMHKTKLDEKLLALTLKMSGTKPGNIVIAFTGTTMFASMIMSASAVTAMMVAAIMPLLTGLKRPGLSKALLLGIAAAGALGGMGTIIASTQNALTAGLLERNGIKVDFLQWMLYAVPVAIVLTAITCVILIRGFIKDPTRVAFDFLADKTNNTRHESVLQRNIVIAVVAVTVLCWLTTSLHGISVAAISAIPIVVLTLTGIITGNDVKALPWDTLLLVAGGLSLGTALESTHILEHYAARMRTMNISSIGFILILAYVTMIVSTLMSNSAAAAILIPLGFAVMPALQKQVALSIGLASSTGIFLPVSAVPNMIVFGTGLLKQRDFRIAGILIGILGPLLAVLWVLLLAG